MAGYYSPNYIIGISLDTNKKTKLTYGSNLINNKSLLLHP